MCESGAFLTQCPAVRTRSGATSMPPQPRDVGEPRHGLGGDGLAADHRARRRGGGESDQTR